MLLSADPVAAVVPAIVMDDRDRQAAAPGFHSFDSVPSDGTASLISLEPLAAPTAQTPATVLNNIDPELRAGSLEQVPGHTPEAATQGAGDTRPDASVLIDSPLAPLNEGVLPQPAAEEESDRVNLAPRLPSSLTDPLGVTDWSAPGIGLPVEVLANPRLAEDGHEETDERLDLTSLTTLVSLPRIDAAALERAGFHGTELRVERGQVLGGSGLIDGSVYNDGIASPGYSPGVQAVSGDWTQTAAGTVEFEFSGTSPGTGAGFHDQVNVSGRATLAGTIDLKLLDGFKPKAGDEFVVLTYGSVSGQFERGTGLFGLHDDVWFDIVQTGNTTTAGQVKLVARELGSGVGTGLRLAETVGLDTKKNQIGELLNADYFVTAQTVSFNGAFELGGLNVAGQFSLAATPGFARATLAANDLTVSLAGQQVTGDFSISVPLASSGATELAISDAALQAARAWKAANPNSRQANLYILQILLALNRVNDSLQALRDEVA
ncbi:MAG: hypothetical protein EBT33_18245, partial [Betaproteobacteria bacterium]|nr:hypothetical protein [Betaproteobacteria bacterium]